MILTFFNFYDTLKVCLLKRMAKEKGVIENYCLLFIELEVIIYLEFFDYY